MSPACPGWDRFEINLGTSTGAQVTFNNGQGTWDNNHGANYAVGTGLASVAGGVLTSGTNPCTQQDAPVRR
jgi:hypothetical protein